MLVRTLPMPAYEPTKLSALAKANSNTISQLIRWVTQAASSRSQPHMLWVWDIGRLCCAAVFGAFTSYYPVLACLSSHKTLHARYAHMSNHIHTCSYLDSPKSEHMPIMHTLHATAFMEPVRNIHWSRHGNALSICSGSKARVIVCHISNFYVVIYTCLHYNVNFHYGIITF